MTAMAKPADLAAATRFEGALQGFDPARHAAQRSLLRFITCGSVDDGKSTLIGRLLADTAALPDDQIAALTKGGKEIDYALLLDGLAAEREQGITIDVAYRYFSTEKRAFIVADTPGHEQYTRNMATGASGAEAAIILVDARKGLLPQTRRHSFIVSLLGVRHVILAVNKMDLVGHSEETFRAIESAYRSFAQSLGFVTLQAIPLAAKLGENVRHRAAGMPWYAGPTLVEALETLDTESQENAGSARFVVQWVNRPDLDFRGFSGFVAAGRFRPGDGVRILPSNVPARIARLVTYDGDLPDVGEGQSITLTLDREVDVSRGDVIVADDGRGAITNRLSADLLWMSNADFDPARPLLIKIGAKTVPARIEGRNFPVFDVATGGRTDRALLQPNDIGKVAVITDAPVVAVPYEDDRALGAFILIDRESNDTVAMGMVRAIDPLTPVAASASGAERAEGAGRRSWIASAQETKLRSVVKAFTWRATGSIDTFVLAYLFTGQAKVAAGISLAEIATKLVLFYGHERAWARIPFGIRKTGGA